MTEYPYPEGNAVVLGPEVFAAGDGRVICWKGRNYYLRPEHIISYVEKRYARHLPETLRVGEIIYLRGEGQLHFNPVTGEFQDHPWTVDLPDEPTPGTLSPDPNAHVLQFRGRPDGQLDAYCRNPEWDFRR